jgi:small conductance mechanosensitive channel
MKDINEYAGIVLDKVTKWLESLIVMLPNFLAALLVLIVFYIASRYIRKLVYGLMSRITKNEAINKLTASSLFFTVLVIGVFISLRILNLDETVTSLLAGLGIVGLALGFAFKDIAANFIAGIYMAIKSPVNVGDVLEYQDVFGIVKDIGLRSSSIRTWQGQDVVIPNRLLMEQKYTHFSINQERRIDLDVGISYGDDLEKVEKVTLQAINEIGFIDKQKPVDLYFKEFGDSAIIFSVRYWVRYISRDYLIYLKALSQGIKNIKKAYDEHDITITFPIRTIDFGIKGGKSLADMINNVEK